MSLPGFFLGLVLLWLFASKAQWLPPGGLRNALCHDQMTASGQVLDYLYHLIVPVTVLVFGALASLQRITRGNMLETLGQQYVTTARAKGLGEAKVILKHALRNAVNPLVTMLGFEFAALFGGAALLEVVLNFPGMGQILLEALIRQGPGTGHVGFPHRQRDARAGQSARGRAPGVGGPEDSICLRRRPQRLRWTRHILRSRNRQPVRSRSPATVLCESPGVDSAATGLALRPWRPGAPVRPGDLRRLRGARTITRTKTAICPGPLRVFVSPTKPGFRCVRSYIHFA